MNLSMAAAFALVGLAFGKAVAQGEARSEVACLDEELRINRGKDYVAILRKVR